MDGNGLIPGGALSLGPRSVTETGIRSSVTPFYAALYFGSPAVHVGLAVEPWRTPPAWFVPQTEFRFQGTAHLHCWSEWNHNSTFES